MRVLVALLLLTGCAAGSANWNSAGVVWHMEAYIDNVRCVDPCPDKPPGMVGPDGTQH